MIFRFSHFPIYLSGTQASDFVPHIYLSGTQASDFVPSRLQVRIALVMSCQHGVKIGKASELGGVSRENSEGLAGLSRMGVALMRENSTMPFSENEGREFSENGRVEIFPPQCYLCLTQYVLPEWKSKLTES